MKRENVLSFWRVKLNFPTTEKKTKSILYGRQSIVLIGYVFVCFCVSFLTENVFVV